MILKMFVIWIIVMLMIWYVLKDDDSITKAVNGNKKKRFMKNLVKEDK